MSDATVLMESPGDVRRQVAKARNHVQQGVTQLVEAKKLQKKTRKLMCCALITVLIIIIVIVLAVVQPWKYAQKQR